MNFFFLVFFLLCFCIEEWYYIFVWQLRKCEQQVKNVFSTVFSRTQPNTRKYFSKHFWNATKHLKIFSFLKNSISGKYLFSRKYFTWTKHSLSELNSTWIASFHIGQSFLCSHSSTVCGSYSLSLLLVISRATLYENMLLTTILFISHISHVCT